MVRYSEEIKQGIMMEIAGMRTANQNIPVSGKQFNIPATDWVWNDK